VDQSLPQRQRSHIDDTPFSKDACDHISIIMGLEIERRAQNEREHENKKKTKKQLWPKTE
jgi:hypothetical protein